MKLLSIEQIRAWDAYTIEHRYPSLELMERAGRAFTRWLLNNIPQELLSRIVILCGPGNNGGDGLVISRLLVKEGYDVVVVALPENFRRSRDFTVNFERLLRTGIVTIHIADDPPAQTRALLEGATLIVDALWGSGLSRPLEGLPARLIELVNSVEKAVVSVDIPSGLFADKKPEDVAIRARWTVSFQVPKLCFFMPECAEYVGRWVVVDIGLLPEFLEKVDTNKFFLTGRELAPMVYERPRFSHKGTFGHVLVVAGSKGRIGAAILCGLGALRAGAGLVTLHVPSAYLQAVHACAPELMTSPDLHPEFFTQVPELERFTVVVVGPGLGTCPESVSAFASLIEKWRGPLVVDADGLNILAANPELLKRLPPLTVLTPHPGEFRRLFGADSNSFEQIDRLSELAQQHRAYIILKRHHTVIATPEGHIYFNTTGNPGMATAGSGDVLAGMIAGFLAQGYCSRDAVLLGVYLHGLAGDLALQEETQQTLTATKLLEWLPAAINHLRQLTQTKTQ